ncbi:hypothetical protein KKB10_01465 [Patescibacteria group bacterium]|nr:hypothetical protein [Patescibacteria group bacterium]MBU1952020.1 hypothetical protein [Patescibacteria group bacterium]
MNTFRWFLIVLSLIFVLVCFSVAMAEVAVKNLELEELWHIGGENDNDVLLEFVRSVVRDGENIYILDTKAARVHHYKLNGEFVTIYDIAGTGPGQCDNAHTLLFLGDGKFGLVQGLPAKIIVSDLNDNPAPTIKFHFPGVDQNTPVAMTAVKGQGNYILGFNEIKNLGIALSIFKLQDNRHGRLQAYEVARLFQDNPPFTGEIPDEAEIPYYSNRDVWDISAEGLLYVAPYRDQYLIHVYRADGSLINKIKGEYNPCLRSYDLMDYHAHLTSDIHIYVEDSEPAIMGLHIIDGEIWVRSGCSDYQDVYRQYDVIDSEGQFSHLVNLFYPGTGFKDDLVFLGDGLVAIVKGNSDRLKRGFFLDNPKTSIEEDVVQVILCHMKE